MKIWATSLKARLVGYFALLSLVMTSSLGALVFGRGLFFIENLSREQLVTMSLIKEDYLKNYIEAKKKVLQSIVNSFSIIENLEILLNKKENQRVSNSLNQDIKKILKEEKDVKEIWIMNPQGEVIFATKSEKKALNFRKEEFFIQGKNHTYIGNIKDFQSLTISTPLMNEKGIFIGVLATVIDLSSLFNISSEYPQLNQKAEVYLIDHSSSFIIRKYPITLKDQNSLQKVISRKNSQGKYCNSEQETFLIVERYLPEYSLGLILALKAKDAFLPAYKLAFYIIIITLIFTALSTLVFYLLAQEIIKPILAIKDTVIKVRDGDLKAVAPIFSEDEVGILAENFNQMVEEFSYLYQDFQEQVTQLELAEVSAVYTYQELEKEKQKVEIISNQLTKANEKINLLNTQLTSENLGLTEQLKRTNEKLTQFLDAIPVGIIVFDTHGNVYYANYKAKELLGENLEFKQELYLYNSATKYPSEITLGVQSLQLGIAAHTDNMEVHQNKKIIPLESWETPIFNNQGNIDYAIVAFQDITERRTIEQERQKFTEKILKLNQANERFVPREFLQLLNKNSITDVELGDNIEREMTVLFSDIRDFTKLSENMTPTDNFRFINAFLSRLGPCITKYNGFIDKYIGDAIMALFSSNADDAVKAAISMLERLKKYNTTRQRPERQPIKIGIGINTGLMMLGTVGSQHRLDNTVISDAVNLAARLEALTKDYRISLLISQNTFLRLQDSSQYCLRLVDCVTVKGRSIPVSVYEVFDADEPEIKDYKLATKTLLEQGISLYHLGNFKAASMNFRQCLKINPNDHLCQIYLQRCSLLF